MLVNNFFSSILCIFLRRFAVGVPKQPNTDIDIPPKYSKPQAYRKTLGHKG